MNTILSVSCVYDSCNNGGEQVRARDAAGGGSGVGLGPRRVDPLLNVSLQNRQRRVAKRQHLVMEFLQLERVTCE